MRVKLSTRLSLPFLLLAAYACGDDDSVSYVPTPSGQDATVATDSGSTPGADSAVVADAALPTADTGTVAPDTGTATQDAGKADTGVVTTACTAANTFAVTNNGATAYVFSRDGAAAQSNPNIGLVAGTTYCFDINASGHPFFIKNVQGAGTANALPGVTNNGTASGRIVYTPSSTDGTVSYNCQFHGTMTGRFLIALP